MKAALLARLTFALSAVALPLASCGDADSGAAGPGGTSCARAFPVATNGSSATQIYCRDTAADCTPTKQGICRTPGISACSGGGGDQGRPEDTCADDAACAGAAPNVCQAQEQGGPYCRPRCTSDAMCGASQQCETATGHCLARPCADAACPAESYCTAAKTCARQACNAARPCGIGQTCSADDFACRPTACDPNTAGACPSTFSCDAADKTCKRTVCSCDAACGDSGYCVNGLCQETPGTCDNSVCGRPLITDGAPVVAGLVRGEVGWTA